MKKILQTLILLLLTGVVFAQTDFVPGANTIFQDDFNRDPEGDFPAKWNTSGDGQVVMIDGTKWLKIKDPTAVSPDLKKSLPENCTVEFDLYLKSTTGVAPRIMFGLTTLSNMSVGDVYRSHISVTLEGYNEGGSLVYAKNIQDLGHKSFPLQGYIERILHVSVSINKTRFRVYLDEQKVVDLPKLLTPEYRKNFFIASSNVIPSPEESIYISNLKIAEGEADARSLLIKQLMEEGSATTNAIQFTPANEMTTASQPLVDQLGQTLQQNPDMNIQINSVEQIPPTTEIVDPNATTTTTTTTTTENTESNLVAADPLTLRSLKLKADKIKSYLVSKFKIQKDRIVTDAKVKFAEEKTRLAGKAKQLLTEFIKLQ